MNACKSISIAAIPNDMGNRLSRCHNVQSYNIQLDQGSYYIVRFTLPIVIVFIAAVYDPEALQAGNVIEM